MHKGQTSEIHAEMQASTIMLRIIIHLHYCVPCVDVDVDSGLFVDCASDRKVREIEHVIRSD